MKATLGRGSRSWPSVCLWLAASTLSLTLTAGTLRAQGTVSKEYQIKAVFLFNFLQFVEWPAAVFVDADTPIRVGVLGEDPFGPALDAAVREETVSGRKLVVRRSQRVEDLQDCQLLFIAESENRRLSEILPHLEGRPVLTVSETEGFARRGGVIAFYSQGQKVRFEINTVTARRQGLKISSQLLNLAKIVVTQPPVEGR